jgi:DNA-binding Lrp family transcriptional regulator
MMKGLPQVRAVHTTNGRWDLIAEIGTRTLEEFDSVLANIRRFEDVSISETNLLLSTKKSG